ncbi:DNA ligase 1 [Durio zibethinus]|uniref:DNA ligase 1 n=1 Tax=Durio zibethinus TaxID=66656 RepID=A0A6P5WG05_DURZI|nr:DNA ligase 1 [Durio zibethinus]
MDPPSSSQTSTPADAWELCNDDGFIYKREKRRRVLTEPAPSPGDPEEEEKRRREWKRKNLLRVKERYKKEIEEWEILSKTLKAMQEKALGFQAQQQERIKLRETEEKQRTASSWEKKDNDKKDKSLGSSLDELLSQAEAQETIILDVSNLCDIAEAMCNAQEERLKQTYFDLPIWASPRDLMASLCDDE